MSNTNIIVRGMSMPPSCLRCPLIKKTGQRGLGYGASVAYWKCQITNTQIEIAGEHTGRMKDCPLFEVKDWAEL